MATQLTSQKLTYEQIVALQRHVWSDHPDPAIVAQHDQALMELRELAIQAGMTPMDAKTRPITTLFTFVARDTAPIVPKSYNAEPDGDLFFA